MNMEEKYQIFNQDYNGNTTWYSDTYAVSVFRDFKDVSDNWVVKVTKPYEDLTKDIVYQKFPKREDALKFAKNFMEKH